MRGASPSEIQLQVSDRTGNFKDGMAKLIKGAAFVVLTAGKNIMRNNLPGYVAHDVMEQDLLPILSKLRAERDTSAATASSSVPPLMYITPTRFHDVQIEDTITPILANLEQDYEDCHFKIISRTDVGLADSHFKADHLHLNQSGHDKLLPAIVAKVRPLVATAALAAAAANEAAEMAAMAGEGGSEQAEAGAPPPLAAGSVMAAAGSVMAAAASAAAASAAVPVPPPATEEATAAPAALGATDFQTLLKLLSDRSRRPRHDGIALGEWRACRGLDGAVAADEDGGTPGVAIAEEVPAQAPLPGEVVLAEGTPAQGGAGLPEAPALDEAREQSLLAEHSAPAIQVTVAKAAADTAETTWAVDTVAGTVGTVGESAYSPSVPRALAARTQGGIGIEEWLDIARAAADAAQTQAQEKAAASEDARRESDKRASAHETVMRELADLEAQLEAKRVEAAETERAMQAAAQAAEEAAAAKERSERKAKRKADRVEDLQAKRRRANELEEAARAAEAAAKAAQEEYARAAAEEIESDDSS